MTTSVRAAPRLSSIQRRQFQLFWSNRMAAGSMGILLIMLLIAAVSPLIESQVLRTTPEALDLTQILAGPTAKHPLGTDNLGRDVAARLLSGARISLGIGLACAVVTGILGLLVGMTAAYYGGWVDNLLMRFTDTMMAIPSFFAVLTVAALASPSVLQIVLLIAAFQWMYSARLIRSDVLSLRRREYVTAALSYGAPDRVIVVRHLLPGVVPTLIVAMTLSVAWAILTESALSFLGIGIRPPQASWGSMLSGAQLYLYSRPLLAVYPGVLIVLTVLTVNFVGDGLREALDPRFQ